MSSRSVLVGLLLLCLVFVSLSTPGFAAPATQAPAAPVAQDGASITSVGTIGGTLYAGAVQDNYAYLKQGNYLRVLDLTAAPPRTVANLPLSLTVYDLFIAGNRAYFAGEANFGIIDISDPLSTTLLSTLTVGSSQQLCVTGNYAYLACADWLFIVNVANKAAPTQAGRLETKGNPLAVQFSTPNVFLIASSTSDLVRVVDRRTRLTRRWRRLS